MTSLSCLDFSQVEVNAEPYLHFSARTVLRNGLEQKVYSWLKTYKEWELVTMDFYTQYEFSLFDAELPMEIAILLSKDTVESLKAFFQNTFTVANLELVGITAHKLVEGHRIGIHNDFLGSEETHRLIIQLNPGWEDERGGFLMLFRSADSEAVAKIVRPLHNTAFGFAISETSLHAVSRVNDFERYTLVYTLKAFS